MTLDGKECKICGKLKPIEEFYRNGVNKNGTIRRRAACKECFKSDEMPKYNSHKIYKQILTQDYLLDAYIVRGLDLEDIAAEIRTKYPKKYNCTATTISTYMRRHKLSTRSIRSMVTNLDAEAIVRTITKMDIPDQKVKTLTQSADKEAINICISDTHVGQKFYNETEEEAALRARIAASAGRCRSAHADRGFAQDPPELGHSQASNSLPKPIPRQ